MTKNMTRKPVVSSRVKSIGHEGDVMEVEFNNNDVWQYSPVDKNRYLDVIKSPTIGSAIQSIVSDRSLTAKKL